ncbi:MAG: OprD family outer membrane porin [Shewanella sp.]
MMMKKSYLSLVVLSALAVPAIADTTIDKMFSEGTVKGELRLLDFTKDFDGNTTTQHTTSLGGLFYYNTAKVNGLSIGTSFASANPIWVNDSDAVYNLVGQDSNGDHQSVNRMQEYYVQGDWWNTQFRLGAQELRTPMMNPHDIRAIPRTFRGFSAENHSIDNLTLSALYITDSMGWTDARFISVSEAVKAEVKRNTGKVVDVEDSPMYAIGAKYQLPFDTVKTQINLWQYYMEDVFQQTYAKVNLSTQLGSTNLYFIPSYLNQQATGNKSAGELDTYQYGFHLGAKLAGMDLTYMYAKTGDDTVLTPWGDDKVVIQQVYQSALAGEEVNALKLEYDFGQVGAKGLSAYAFYGNYDSPESLNDFTETNFSVTYKFGGAFEGLGLRARYAMVDFDQKEDLNDLRLYLTYKFALGH